MPPKINDGLTKYQRYILRHPEKRRKTKSSSQRKQWANWNEEERANYHLKKRHKITYQDAVTMLNNQSDKCYLCDKEIQSLGIGELRAVVDHDHKTKKIRKILCQHCNRALGLIKERIDVLKNMINYIEEHS